ncbi:MBL fold metallo-hydrolase [Marinovum sp. 2_MG-2023]|uniref:MBL fold metallo-hydrolase n=1 Tax=unclassified Marinovum TaxID=2647166 RepID=UPI0026E38151|nr:MULTISPECIES: MBL fold metallo-hydrolase [unclassified Marinovum]MDO6731626.1 MBL fold metallo-hydrolase [Marinovum sp. 2_MG-2023]MDO6778248.1 MBL fold metallo-hydrolase [Marinovum sp. 1_MG-2023]
MDSREKAAVAAGTSARTSPQTPTQTPVPASGGVPSDAAAPLPGAPITLAPGLVRILAPNASPMTYWGTNTYLLGQGDLAVIDPGPNDPGHLEAILAAVPDGARISHIIVTHAHLDHSPLARPLANACGAPVLAFGKADAGRSAVMQRLAASGFAGGGEGLDHDFRPDESVVDGQVIAGDGWDLRVHHTPGHMGNHICLGWGDALFSGDHVMGWASSLVSPPDGDLSDFMASCVALQAREWQVFFPGHGAAVPDPMARLNWLINHRKTREAAILQALTDGPAGASELAARLYTDVPAALLPAAARNVFAHLIDLYGKNTVAPVKALAFDQSFRLI